MVLTSPLAADASVVCTGTYTLTAQDINNLLRTNLATVKASDQYDYEVEASVTDTVMLEQVNLRDKPHFHQHGPFDFSTDRLLQR